MQDDAHVMGHLFVTFVAALLRFELARLIDEADLASSYSPEDVLDVYATMKVVTGDAEIRQVVPKQGQAAGHKEEEGQEAEGFRTLIMNLYPSLPSLS